MSDQVMTVTIKGIGDFSDVVSNVGSVQKALTKLKLPDKLGDSLNKNITAFYKEYEKYQKKITEGVKTQGDYNQVEKSLNNMRSLYQAIGKDAQKLTQLDMKDMLNLDTGEVKKIMDELTSVVKQIGSVKIDTTPFTKAFADIRSITKNSKISGDNGLLSQIIGSINTGQIAAAKKQLQELENYAKKVAPRTTETGARMPGTLSAEKYQQLTAAIGVMNGAVAQAETAMNPLIERQNDLQRELDETKQKAAQGIKDEFDGYNQASGQVDNLTESLKRMHQEEFSFNREAQNIDRQIQSYFGLSQMIRKVGDIAKDAFATVKELDKAMTETAVVTNFSVGDMWEMLPTYTAQANQLGSTIKDVYDAATLYYQQGLNTNQAMSLANETLKMARIAGLDAADATNMMTAALRGFNMEINQQSAQKINDIYSELAAITASDTKEIGSAMERTASIANSANMEFATTSAFLAQMIETTREAPENLGTAMKTIVARFQEMKQDPTKLIDSEGVAMDANKVDKALKTIGVQLMDTKGEFRDLDDVFLEIASKWDSLSQGQQRYIATIAAGSRQQSRFIAMMSNYERTMELVDAANNSAGASQRQFEKTLDSMEAKLNMLKNAWDQFTMGLMNNQILKFGVDALTEGFTIINKFIDILGRIPPKPFEGITKSALTLATTLGMLNFGKRASRGLIMGGAGWWKGETSLTGGFAQGWKEAGQSGLFGGRKGNQQFNNSVEEARKSGASGAAAYAAAWRQVLPKAGLKDTLAEAFKIDRIKENVQTNTAKGLLETLMPKEQISQEARDQFQYYMQEFQAGNIKREDMPSLISGAISEIDQIQVTDEVLDKMANMPDPTKKMGDGFGKLTSAIGSAGASLQVFGSIVQGTPLEPFGQILITVGTSLTALSGILAGTKAAFMENLAASVSAQMGLQGLTASAIPAMIAEKGLTAGIVSFGTALWATLWPILAVVAAIGTIYGAYKLLDAAIETNKEKFESATDAAAAASEAYDSAKQETSELANAIEQVKTNEDAFDGLVVGTAAFNEQLVNANEQIMELIKKYPMLNDPKYLSTDKNGLMHISDEGLNAVKEYQKQRQANASALNLIQTADLNSEESRQKAQQMRKVKGTDTTESYNQRLKEADLVEQQAKAQQEMAKLNAVNIALVDKEIHNREKVSAIMAEQYDARKNAVNLEGESIHDLKQEYADFYGYKYDKSTKKLTDVEGNEVDVDKDTIKDAVKEIRVITNFEADGKSLDSMLNSIDSKFSNALGDTFAESGNLFSDIMSDNIDIDGDLLENLITNSDKLQSAVDALSEKEIAAVLGVSADAVAEAPDKYKNELTDKLVDKATNIAETQAQSYADLASMLAQTTSADVSQLIDENGQATTKAQKANQQAIKEQLDKLTTEQKNTLSSIGNALSEGAGVETMRTFIRQATDIYTKGTQESITALDSIIKDVNWSSPTARLKAYNDMINSADKDVQNLGNSLRNSSESSNLLGEAFEEFYDSSDFQEMAENMDKFADSSGKLNASSIQEMAKECGSLNNLLDTGAISAGGVAAALNAMGADGNITILDLNENLLKFLSTANQLEDTLAEAHSLIENFDWGVDTGESEDFAKESTKKWKELYDNGEFGNQQLENYAKFVLGQERWNNELEKSGGNIEKALDSMSGDILKYSDGFEQAWIDMANSSSISDVHYGEGGDIIWDTQGKTTQELVDWLAETRGITQEWAKLMVEDFANYSYDFKTELAANDFNAALENGDYITSRKGTDGNINITQGEIQTLAAAQNKTEQEITAAIAKSAGIAEDELNIIKNIDDKGNVLMGTGDIASLNTQYSQAELGKDTTASWISQYVAQTRQGQNIEGSTDLKAAISGAIADGFQADQANEMARTEGLKAWEEGAKVFYDGVELQREDLADSQAFTDKIAEITENSRWNAVGEAIAQGYISYIKGTENPNQSNDSSKNGTSDLEPASYGDKGSNITIGTPTEDPKEEARKAAKEKFDSWIQGLKEGTNTPTEDPKIAAGEKSRQQWSDLWASIKQAFTEGTPTEDPKVEAVEKARTTWKNIWDGVKQAFNTPTSVPEPKQSQGNAGQSAVQNQDTTVTIHTEDSELDATKAKIDTVIEAASKPQTVTITANVGKSTDTALTSINKIKEATKGNNAINVNAKVKGKDDVNNLGSVITNVKPKTISVTANVSGANKVTSLRNEISNLRDKDVYITTHKRTVNDGGGGAKGIHNRISYRSIPSLGSMAGGGRYGRLGPKGKGGLTLTGEEGFEIAWLPSESRSMILGADGPQMINLPSDAVVYTHEQSKDILRKRQEIEAGSHAGRHVKGWNSSKNSSKSSSKSSSSSGSDSSSSSSSSGSNEVHFSIEEVVRFNLDKKIEAMTSKIKKLTEEIDKNLKKIGTTALDITDSTQEQIKNLKSIKTYNDSLVASYQKDLNALDLNKYMMKVSYTDENGKSQDYSFDAQWYLYQSDGQYYINDSYIRQLSSPAQQKAVFDAVKGALDPLVSGLQKAKDAADDAQKQIEDLAEKLADTFYGWENELTEIYDLTQHIKNETSFTDRFTSQIELDLSRLGVGLGKTSDAISNINAVLNRSNQTIRDQIENQKQLIDARKRELDNALSAQDELDKIEDYRNSEAYAGASDEEREAVIQKLTDEYDVAANALAYVTDIVRDLDGSVTYNIDWKAFEEANRQNPLNKETYDALKSYLDDLNSAATDFNGSVKDQTDLLKQTYDDLKKYQDTIVDFEGALLKGVEDQLKNETENAKNLSDSISNALKDLLDEVKRKLDERRKQEDNAKTERDIAQKQQRLAALRANTSGGNQVEIAQLEKEIADAQQSYGRTLEDQLLDRLQQQGDEAKLQRERQIELAEASNEIGAANNRALVNLWLQDPQKYKEQIKEAWLESQGYDEKGYAEQKSLLNQWEVEWTNLLTAIEQTDFNESTKNIEDNTYTLVKLLEEATGAVVDGTERNTETLKDLKTDLEGAQKAYSKGISIEALQKEGLDFKAKDLLTAGYTPSQLAKAGYGIDKLVDAGITDIDTLRSAGFGAKDIKQATGITDASAFKEAGFTADDLLKADFGKEVVKDLFDAKALKEAGFEIAELKDKFNLLQLKNAGYDLLSLRQAGFKASEFGASGISYADAKKAGFTAQDLKGVAQYAKQAAAELQPKVSQGSDLAYGSTGSGVTLLQKTLNKLGIRDNYGNALDTDGYFGQRTREAVINFQRKYKNKASRTLSADGVVGYYTKEAFRALGYKTGGLADYTGPAWLDGTPSKPELVLNPTDTKNFLALRDVLSSVMKSTGAVSNSYGGDIMYDINIHVDKIEKDYDVDRVVDKVKKEITKGAGYRNVTQVRNFR